MSNELSNESEHASIGRIPLKQVRVTREPHADVQATGANPMNRLVPYLDLFARLDNDELARLANVDIEVCATLRAQVTAIGEGLAPYVDLLPRLTDSELVRLTGATKKTIRFWRLCQPKPPSSARSLPSSDTRTDMAIPQPQADEVTPAHGQALHGSACTHEADSKPMTSTPMTVHAAGNSEDDVTEQLADFRAPPA